MKIHQSGNEIIVTQLNPMCDAPESGDFIAFTRDFRPCSVYLKVLNKCVINSALSRVYDLDYFIGWLPMPIYDPAHKQPDDFSRGVRTMFDYLQTRIANNFSGNKETQAHLNEINNTLKDWLSDALKEVSPDDYQEWISTHQAYAAGIEKYKRDHERYEKLRKLNVQQFSELYERNIRGENFDEMVDEL